MRHSPLSKSQKKGKNQYFLKNHLLKPEKKALSADNKKKMRFKRRKEELKLYRNIAVVVCFAGSLVLCKKNSRREKESFFCFSFCFSSRFFFFLSLCRLSLPSSQSQISLSLSQIAR